MGQINNGLLQSTLLNHLELPVVGISLPACLIAELRFRFYGTESHLEFIREIT